MPLAGHLAGHQNKDSISWFAFPVPGRCGHVTECWPMECEGRVCEQLSGTSWREGVCPFSSLPPLAACSVDEEVSHCGWFGGGLGSREGIATMERGRGARLTLKSGAIEW